jgi:hypothetical protein
MTRFCAAVLVTIAAALPAGAARAAFEPPVAIGQGGYRPTVTAATDAAGRTTAILSGVKDGTRIVQRASPAVPWAPSQPLPGRSLGRAAGPVVAAGGQGALGVAWRIDRPEKYGAIAAAVADPGGALGAPAVVSDPDAGGVRHPALATDAFGHMVLAYNTGTRASHLSLTGAIAISLREAGGAFGAPVVVDRHASARPAVAIADDGRGIVAWTHDRRVWAVSFDAGAGTVGNVVALTGEAPHQSVVATVGPGGAATVGWLTQRTLRRGSAQTTRYEIQALHRVGGGARFPKRPLTIVLGGYVKSVVAVADGDGTTTLAWTQRMFDERRSVGTGGITASVQSATIGSSQTRFRAAVAHNAPGDVDCGTPSLAARAGRAVLGWSCTARTTATVYTQPVSGSTAPTPLLSYRINPRLSHTTPVVATLDATGTTTILTTTAELPDLDKPPVTHVLATTGR